MEVAGEEGLWVWKLGTFIDAGLDFTGNGQGYRGGQRDRSKEEAKTCGSGSWK